MKWIGLTGGIACGKSTVSRALRQNSIPIIDADEIARSVVATGTPGLKAVEQEFGADILQADGSLDRNKLGQIVFGNPDRLRKLEAITHPLIRAEVKKLRDEFEGKGESLAIYDVPLLFESKAQSQFDEIIVISCTADQQRERMQLRDSQLSATEIGKRIAAQIPMPIKEAGADFVVRNDRDEAHLQSEIQRLMQWLEELKKN